MKNFVGCYSAPLAEPCVQIDDPEYDKKVRVEINAWLHQLERTFPFTKFVIKEQSHDLGDYYEVVIPYEEFDDEAEQRAFNVVDELPYNWDYKAKEELGKAYFEALKKNDKKAE